MFTCSLSSKKDSLVIDGKLEGVIAEVPRGENGFGYDSLFYLPNKNKTLAEISQEEKNSISHRANALQKLEGYLDDWLENDDA